MYHSLLPHIIAVTPFLTNYLSHLQQTVSTKNFARGTRQIKGHRPLLKISTVAETTRIYKNYRICANSASFTFTAEVVCGYSCIVISLITVEYVRLNDGLNPFQMQL